MIGIALIDLILKNKMAKNKKIHDKNPLDKIPSRIKYYLLDWKDKNMEDYILRHGESRLFELNEKELYELFISISEKDIKQFRQKNK